MLSVRTYELLRDHRFEVPVLVGMEVLQVIHQSLQWTTIGADACSNILLQLRYFIFRLYWAASDMNRSVVQSHLLYLPPPNAKALVGLEHCADVVAAALR